MIHSENRGGRAPDVPAPRSGDAARRHARALTEASGTSFYWGMRILPRARREAMYAIYAFCREVDDIADGGAPASEKRAALDRWRAAIARLYDGAPDGLVAEALQPAIRRFGLRREDFLAVIDGMEMDANGPIVAPDWETLMSYCDRVAGAVGLLSIRAFGDPSPAAERFAVALGRALQLTNILRDIGEDAAIGRLYLPRESLDDAGIVSRDPRAVLREKTIRDVCADVAREAQRQFAAAARERPHIDRRAMRPAFIMGAIYRRILDRLVRRGWTDFEARVSLPAPTKLAIVLRYAFA